MGSIIVTNFKDRGSFPLIRISLGPMQSTHSLFHGIYSDILAGTLPYFYIKRFIRWHMSHSVTSF